jgi:hypothetical protein
MSSTDTSFCPESGESANGVEMLDEIRNGEVTESGHSNPIMARPTARVRSLPTPLIAMPQHS